MKWRINSENALTHTTQTKHFWKLGDIGNVGYCDAKGADGRGSAACKMSTIASLRWTDQWREWQRCGPQAL
jgi:hypothetical protein